MECPRCKNTLNTSVLTDVKISFEVEKCEKCGGIWIDKNKLSKVDKIIEPAFIEIRHINQKEQFIEQFIELKCPSCFEHPVMLKIEHPRDNKVIVDYCPECKGIWLDGGELEAIQKENWLITLGKIFKWLLGKEG